MREIIQEDQQLFLYLNNLGSSTFDAFWELMSGKWFWIPLYVIFLYLLFKNYKPRNLIYILIFIALGITVSDQLAGIFKNGILRLRPCHTEFLQDQMRIVECGGSYGFYSSHASNSFFIATFLTVLLRKKYVWLPYFLFFWAAVVSYSRIYLGVHFPMDIIFGALAGFFLGGFFGSLSLKVINKQKIF